MSTWRSPAVTSGPRPPLLVRRTLQAEAGEQAMSEYRAAQQRQLENMQRLRRERTERTTTSPPPG